MGLSKQPGLDEGENRSRAVGGKAAAGEPAELDSGADRLRNGGDQGRRTDVLLRRHLWERQETREAVYASIRIEKIGLGLRTCLMEG